MKSTKMSVSGGTSVNPQNSSNDHNQPIDLAQKSHSVRSSESNVKGGTATLVHFETQIIAPNNSGLHGVDSKQGARKESPMSGTTVAFVPRQPGFQVSGSGTALNLVSPNPAVMGSGTTLRSVSHPSTALTIASSCPAGSPPPSAHSGYHIPKGAAAVANMAASRSQCLTSIVRTSSQTISTINAPTLNTPRGGLVGQRVVPISTGPTWTSRTSPATGVITSKLTTAPISSRANITTPRPQAITSTTYGANLQKTTSVSATSIRPQTPGVRTVVSEVLRVQTPKGVQIAHPVAHTQKYITTGSNLSGRGNSSAIISPGSINAISTQNPYTPSSTLVTSLASSGTTITPHPPMRSPSSAIPVRITAASSGISQGVSSTITAITMTTTAGTPTCGAILTHHPASLQQIQHVESHHVPIKTPIVRNTLTTSHPKIAFGNVSGATQIAFPGSKILTQGQQGSPTLTVAQIPNVSLNSKVGPHSQTQSSSFIRGRGASIPLAKVVPSGSTVSPLGGHSPNQTQSVSARVNANRAPHAHAQLTVTGTGHSGGSGASSVVLHRTPHQGVSVPTVNITQGEHIVTTMPQYSITTAPFYNDSNQISLSASIIPSNLGSNHVATSVSSSGSVRSTNSSLPITTTAPDVGNHSNNSISTVKPNSSPRPSILRKRPDFEGVLPLKAAKNLSHALSIPLTSPPSPKRPDSRGNGNVSSGSAVSANSSPGLHPEEDFTSRKQSSMVVKREGIEDSGPLTSLSSNRSVIYNNSNNSVINSSLSAGAFSHCSLPKDGMSPRKKPRKQKLMGNELQEARNSEDDAEQQHSIKKFKKEIHFTQASFPEIPTPPIEMNEDKPSWSSTSHPSNNNSVTESSILRGHTPKLGSSSPEPTTANTRPHMCLMNSYRQTWKSRHNHFVRQSEIRQKEEKKKTINEIANQKLAFQRVNGWKVMHLSGQVEDLVDLESDVVERLRLLLSVIEKRNHDYEKDVNRLSELVKANLQRSKIIRDQMSDAKVQMSKIFDHKSNIVDIMNKYSNKRVVRKKEKV